MHCGDRLGSLIIDRGYRGGSAKRPWGALLSAEEALPKDVESIELKDLSGATNDVIQTTDVETALKTINDPQIDVAWVAKTTRDRAGVREATTRMRDKLANNLAKLSATDDRRSEIEKHLARERRKLTETDDTEIQQDIRDRMKKLPGELSDLERKTSEARSPLHEQSSSQSQINRIRETIRRLLHEDTTLAERIRTLFREQGITIVSILTAIGMAISTLVLALTDGRSVPVPSPTPRPPDKGGVKEWVKSTYRPLVVPWPIWPARPLRPCRESSGPSSPGS